MRHRWTLWTLGLLAGLTIMAAAATGEEVVTVTATLSQDSFLPGLVAENALQVAAVHSIDKAPATPMADLRLTVEITSGCGSIVLPDRETRRYAAKTDTNGELRLSLKTCDHGQPPILTISADAPGKTVSIAPSPLAVPLTRYQGSILSDRVASEVILGTTFQDKYAQDGSSQGFSDIRFLGQLAIDTLLRPRPQAKSGTAVHTRLDIRFSSFPVADTGTQAKKFTDYADSMSASVGLVYEPDTWSLYTPSSKDPENPYDAMRIGIVAKAGMTSRDKLSAADHGDTLISSYALGFRLTHHQTRAASGNLDIVNKLPIRYFEATVARYEEFAGRSNTNRLVIETGLRLPVISGDNLPFYAGVYANVGQGPDDVRVFAALVFQLDKLVTLFQR